MAYQALYRKYRPNTFADFIDQDCVKQILVNSIKNNKISHAYLFSGPRGIGKTSMAKIFAKAINCLDFQSNDDVCNECENCKRANEQSVDIIEIDAASNNGVDQIRDLKNKISIVPSELKYKIYIIDEVHMLTNSAFNALLKTLEEPPSYVVFILATTEFYEVPETIVSRCQCFSFGRISVSSLEKRLRYISNKENIDITDDAISEIALYANGGLRDAIGMLDKLRSFTDKQINTDIYKSINGVVSQEEINNFYCDLFSDNIANILALIDKIENEGYDFKNFIERVMFLIRDKIVTYYTDKAEILGSIEANVELVNILNEILNRIKYAVEPMIIVQIYLLKFVEQCNNKWNKNSENISQEILNKKENVSVINENNADKIISQEINNENREKIVTKKMSKKEENISREIKNELESSFTINEKTKKVRINNAMATADLKYKKEMSNLWKNLDKYFMDDKYGKVAQLLSDTVPMVVGTNYMILTTISSGIVNNLYTNFYDVEKFIANLYHQMSIVVLLNEEFDNIKEKYIEDRKNNITYQIQKECDKLINEKNDLISEVINIFGSDLVDIE